MRAAADVLVGEHDFSAFRSAECQAAVAGEDAALDRHRAPRRLLALRLRGSAFLHHMVRNIMGCAASPSAAGSAAPAWLADVLAARDRERAAPTFAADGLYFVGPHYEPRHAHPRRGRRLPTGWPDGARGGAHAAARRMDHRTRIKICGLTREADVDAAVAAGADAVGFVFYESSPRCVDVDARRGAGRAGCRRS